MTLKQSVAIIGFVVTGVFFLIFLIIKGLIKLCKKIKRSK